MPAPKTLLLLLVFCALPLAARAQTPAANSSAPSIRLTRGERLRLSGVPNAGRIDNVLYRGAQPRQSGFTQLKELGISTIVDLRSENLPQIAWERRQAESLGIQFVNIPVNGWSPPTDAQVAQFLLIFRDHPGGKVFVHCHFGEDRTGVFVAAYRIAHDGWPADQAINEMYFFGFNGFWHPAMKSYVRSFPAQLKMAPALVLLSKP